MKKQIFLFALVISTLACKQKSETSSAPAVSTPAASTAASSTATTTAQPSTTSTTTAPITDTKFVIAEETFAGIGNNTSLEEIKKIFSGSSITEGKEAAAPES